jgi:hypothetical protein
VHAHLRADQASGTGDEQGWGGHGGGKGWGPAAKSPRCRGLRPWVVQLRCGRPARRPGRPGP